jgi:hypothetical protein
MVVAADLKDCPSIMWDTSTSLYQENTLYVFVIATNVLPTLLENVILPPSTCKLTTKNILRGGGPNNGEMGGRERQNHRDVNLH